MSTAEYTWIAAAAPKKAGGGGVTVKVRRARAGDQRLDVYVGGALGALKTAARVFFTAGQPFLIRLVWAPAGAEGAVALNAFGGERHGGGRFEVDGDAYTPAALLLMANKRRSAAGLGLLTAGDLADIAA